MALDDIQKQRVPQETNFYRNHYHRVIIFLAIVIVTMIVAVAVLLNQILHRPLPQFDAMQPDGKRMTLTSYNEPNLQPQTILQWASKAATVAYTFDFVNYRKQIAAVRPYFTNDGWLDYQGSVRGLINTIVQNQLFINGIVSGTPVISNQGKVPGKGYVWRIQIPFLVTYQSANTTSKQKYFVVISIVRVSTEVNPQGIGIDQFVMR